MDLKTYNETTGNTAVYPRDVNNFGLAYCFLGLIDEASELQEVLWKESPDPMSVAKESGDCFWYLSQICNEYTLLNFGKIVVEACNIEHDLPTPLDIGKLAILAGGVKKFYRDGKDLDINLFHNTLVSFFEDIISNMRYYKISLSDTLEMNYAKLIKRRETNTIHGDGDNREENS